MQHRFIKFKDPVNSLPLNERLVGIIPSALYCGFDTMSNISGLSLNFTHEITGEVFTRQNGTVTNRRGAWITKQGVVIKEDAPISVTLETNAGNGSTRTDYLIGRHLHDIIYVGGVAATYEIVKGPLNSNALPTLLNPSDSVILGTFTIPAGATDLNQVKWTRTRTPSLGNEQFAYIAKDNRFTAQQQMNQATGLVTIIENTALQPGDSKGVLGAIDNANSFMVEGYEELDLMPDKPAGTIVTLIFTEAIKINGFVTQLDGGVNGVGERWGYNDGYRPIVINYTTDAFLNIARDTPVQFLKVSSGVAFNGTTNPIYGDYWKVISVGDSAIKIQALNTALAAAQGTITDLNAEVLAVSAKPFDIKEVYLPDPSIYFDASGLGLTDKERVGWAICNGNNGTPNLLGKVTVQYDPADPAFNQVGASGGVKEQSISINQLPSHNFNTVAPGNGGDVHVGTGASVHLAQRSESGGFNREYRLSGVSTIPTTGKTNSIGGGEAITNLQPYFTLLKIMKLPA